MAEESLWYDEAYTAFLVSMPFGDMIQTILEVGLQTSPFYYVVLRSFASFGFSEFNLRILSAIVGAASIPYLAALTRIHGNRRVALLAATLLTINPMHIWYSQEARLYSMLFLVALASMYYFTLNVFSPPKIRNWIALSITLGIGFNLHHFVFYIPFVQLVFLIVTFKANFRLLKNWLFSLTAAGAMFIPWVLTVLDWGRFYGAGAGKPADLSDLFLTLENFSIGNVPDPNLLSYISVIIFITIILVTLRNWSSFTSLLFIWLAIPPLMTVAIFSRFPMYMDRYLIISLPAFLILLALGIENFPMRVAKPIGGLFVIVAMLFGTSQIFLNDAIYEREDWRGVGTYLEENTISAPKNLYTAHWENLVPMLFYYSGDITIQPVFGYQTLNLPPETEHNDESIWLIIPNQNDSSHLYGHCDPFDEGVGNVELGQWRERNSINLVDVKHFECIRIEQYQ